MKLILLIALGCAVASVGEAAKDPVKELGTGLAYLYRRFLQFAAPDQIYLEDALDIKWRDGMMKSIPYTSTDKVTFLGEERISFNSIQSIVSPEQRSFENNGQWSKIDNGELILSYNYGGAVRVNMLTESGVYKAVDMGNPLDFKGTQFTVFIPRGVYFNIQSLSTTDFTLFTDVAVPHYMPEHHAFFSVEEMAAQFPDHGELFKKVARLDVTKDDNYSSRHDEDEGDDDNERDHGRRRGRRGRYSYRSRRRH